MNRIEAHSERTVMVGDRMDTLLVLTGSTRREEIPTYPFRPGRVVESIAHVIEMVR